MSDGIDLNPFRRRLVKRGESAEAIVVSSDIPWYRNADDGWATRDFVLEVHPAGGEPFRAEVKEAFGLLAAPGPGARVWVKFDPKSHKVAFDPDRPFSRADAARAASVPVQVAAAPQKDPAERIEELGRLRDQGLITPEEFDAHKARLLDLL